LIGGGDARAKEINGARMQNEGSQFQAVMSVILYVLYAVDGIAQVLDAYEMLWDALEGSLPALIYTEGAGLQRKRSPTWL
jgi:hypothetical protein